MKKLALLCVVLAVLVAVGIAAEKLDLAEVDVDALTDELQKSKEPTEGMNLVWWMLAEYWEADSLQDETTTAEERGEMLEVFGPYVVLGVVRADISPFGLCKFHDKRSVAGGLKVRYVDAEGKTQVLKPPAEEAKDLSMLLNMMKPMFGAAMGEMGKNIHFFVFSNRDKKGNTLVSPYEKGKLAVELEKTPGEAGGIVEFETPLNSLFVPRKCTDCKKEAHISWNYCPWCGKRLPE
ncbi:MAG: hypothetical protein ACYTF6_02665 [Planctomycetota bacterium]